MVGVCVVGGFLVVEGTLVVGGGGAVIWETETKQCTKEQISLRFDSSCLSDFSHSKFTLTLCQDTKKKAYCILQALNTMIQKS